MSKIETPTKKTIFKAVKIAISTTIGWGKMILGNIHQKNTDNAYITQLIP